MFRVFLRTILVTGLICIVGVSIAAQYNDERDVYAWRFIFGVDRAGCLLSYSHPPEDPTWAIQTVGHDPAGFHLFELIPRFEPHGPIGVIAVATYVCLPWWLIFVLWLAISALFWRYPKNKTRPLLPRRSPVLALRHICPEPADYSPLSPVQPSARGGRKIARRIIAILSGEPCPAECRIYR